MDDHNKPPIFLQEADDDDEGFFSSCWGRLKLKLPWKRARIRRSTSTTTTTTTVAGASSCNPITNAFRAKRPKKPRGGFKYDPLSYAQNFDDGSNWDDRDVKDSLYRGFSGRFAAPVPKPHLDDHQ